MNYSATSRRKQSKPQKVGTDNEKDDSGILLSGSSMSPEPISIEEQFKNQLLGSLNKSTFFKSDDNHDDDDDDNNDNNSVLPSINLTSKKIEEVVDSEDQIDSKLMVDDKADLLFNGLAQFNQQQLLQLYAASLAGNKDLLKNLENIDTNSTSFLGTTTRISTDDIDENDELIKNQWKKALEKTVKDSEDKNKIKCPVDECDYNSNNISNILLHLSEIHKNSEKGGYLNCDSCGECFGDLIEFRKHRCSSELPSTRPQSAIFMNKNETDEDDDKRKTDSVPILPNFTKNNTFQLRNAEQQLNDLERLTTTSTLSTPNNNRINDDNNNNNHNDNDDDDDDNFDNKINPPILFNELFKHQQQQRQQQNNENVLDLSSKNANISNLLSNNTFFSNLNPNLMTSFGIPGQSPFDTSSTSPITPVLPSTSIMQDDDWESMMEISNTDENEKIRQLVGDKVAPPTDPNQCLLCRRVLSCKSALQMHYRTHTGERPFKCKICQRAFTTKGNLKTHMGVHRTKHSIRTITTNSIQQCPICSKTFMNSIQLSQHMMTHQPSNNSNASTPSTPFLFPNLLNFNNFNSSNTSLPLNLSHHSASVSPKLKDTPKTTPKLEPYDVMLAKLAEKQKEKHENDKNEIFQSQEQKPTQNEKRSILESIEEDKKSELILSEKIEKNSTMNESNKSFDLSSVPMSLSTKNNNNYKIDNLTINPLKHKLDNKDSEMISGPSTGSSTSSSSSSISSTNTSTDHSPVKQIKLDVEEPSLILSEDNVNENNNGENPLDAIQKMWKETEPMPQQRQPVQLSKHQCGVCFKHFSSSSALQIHMRTHTGDKPFKCNVCGRAFTTRGNLKVHMGTHSYTQSPSRRGRRIFDFTPELVARQQILNQMAAATSAAASASTSSPTPSPFGFPMNFSPLLAAAFASNQASTSNNINQNKDTKESKEYKTTTTSSTSSSDDMMNSNSLESLFWMLKGTNTCPICQKHLNSNQEMENHIKGHLNSIIDNNNPSAIQLKSE